MAHLIFKKIPRCDVTFWTTSYAISRQHESTKKYWGANLFPHHDEWLSSSQRKASTLRTPPDTTLSYTLRGVRLSSLFKEVRAFIRTYFSRFIFQILRSSEFMFLKWSSWECVLVLAWNVNGMVDIVGHTGGVDGMDMEDNGTHRMEDGAKNEHCRCPHIYLAIFVHAAILRATVFS